MDVLYTLDELFGREEVIDVYASCLWVERFTKSGDFTLVTAATPKNIATLKPGRRMELQGSQEVMEIENQLVEGGLMTVTGRSLEVFFNERHVFEYTLRDKPGNVLANVVDKTAINPAANDKIGGVLNKIPFLALGDIDQNGEAITAKIPGGPMYDALLPIAETSKLGMSVLVVRPDNFNYELKFTVFRGVDRTSGQVQYEPVQFSPGLETMSGVKELQSSASYKTVVYMFPPNWSNVNPVVEYAPGTDPAALGFDRRILVMQASDITEEMVSASVTLLSLMQQRAKDALANNNFTKMIDGEVVPQGFEYNKDYKLGDTIELIGQSGVPQDAMVTEFIRSNDATGVRAYPTVTVL